MICRLTIGFQRDYGDPSASMCSACSVCVKSPKSRLAADGATYKVYGVRRHTLFFATRYLVRFVRLCGGCDPTANVTDDPVHLVTSVESRDEVFHHDVIKEAT
jgi:hypothetical protein